MVAVGLARFAYSLLLPAMRAALEWSFTTAGAVNTANAGGYLAGALLAGPLTAGEPASAPADRRRWPARHVAPLLAAYGLFGAGYIGYITFIVAFLRAHGAQPSEISGFWVVLGAAAIGGGLAWAPALGRLPAGRGAAATLSVVTAGAGVPLVTAAPPAAYISALLFGGSFLAVVTAVTASARRSLQPRHRTAAITALTVAFAAGQCLGPVLAGALADTASGVRAGIALSTGILAAAVPVSLAQPRRDP